MYICAVPLADNTSKKDLVDKMYQFKIDKKKK